MRQIRRLVLIALGSNESSVWGDATATVQKASDAVSRLSDKPAKISHFYQNPAFPAGSGPDFVNAAIVIKTCSPPHSILADLHSIEEQAGRKRTTRWGQRTLDLDLIGAGDLVFPDGDTHAEWRSLSLLQQQQQTPQDLILPHPRVQDRAFVLVPLLDVAPDWRHPVLGQSVRQMCAALPEEARAEVVRLPG
ncbi:2-amino-4-hydroxy-6-hydroxymethyldihydropteridine diphosphokinase [Loktanella sp. Alg231-35]|uniref:2-amino-4-hydroxy-6- hydroxymethyldihydropteridine diphosphokinase n=1 Tax=Loktanella sp. Alg231-35 TaxID=1922220 RepID=UPI000D555BDC|nr:2-amino-4-hydroxy-6-hydroxymethyldihydropteridine diphosphokinase [Loktanella sp. Alg231-35]